MLLLEVRWVRVLWGAVRLRPNHVSMDRCVEPRPGAVESMVWPALARSAGLCPDNRVDLGLKIGMAGLF